MATRGFGVVGGLAPEIVRVIAREAEALGYSTFWANDTPRGDGLATLAEAAAVTERIRLGVGVIPVDRQPAERIIHRAEELALPQDRLILGVGSGGTKGRAALDLVRSACEQLGSGLAAKVVVGALGPRMIALGSERADGVLLNWLTPVHARASARQARTAAAAAGRPEPLVCGYTRTALGPAARPRLVAEADRYGGIPAYAANFARMGALPIETCVTGDDAAAIRAGLAAYDDAVDEIVARAVVAEDTTEAYLALLRAAAPVGFG